MSQGGRHSLFELLADTTSRDRSGGQPDSGDPEAGERGAESATREGRSEERSAEAKSRSPLTSFVRKRAAGAERQQDLESEVVDHSESTPTVESSIGGTVVAPPERQRGGAQTASRPTSGGTRSSTTISPDRSATGDETPVFPRRSFASAADLPAVVPTDSDWAEWRQRASEKTAAWTALLNDAVEVRWLTVAVASMICLCIVLIGYLVGAANGGAGVANPDAHLLTQAYDNIAPSWYARQDDKTIPAMEAPRRVEDGRPGLLSSDEADGAGDSSATGADGVGTHRVDVESGANHQQLDRDRLTLSGKLGVEFILQKKPSRDFWTLTTIPLDKATAKRVREGITKLPGFSRKDPQLRLIR